jgi:hypothetical protein
VRRAARAQLFVAALLAGASGALARIPDPETVARAAAEASRAQGRNKPFSFAVAVRGSPDCKRPLPRRIDTAGRSEGASECGPSAPVARGELLVNPAGAARIELRHDEGFRERQLRRASGLAAARDGEPQGDPHALAPPFWLLQAATGGELLARAGELGAAPGQIALAYDGARDCYVIGGAAGGPSVWIDKDTYQVARVDLAEGTTLRFLAWASSGGAILPGTIQIETPSLTFTLELTNAAPATPAADAFSDAWLLGR